jgi:ABC-type cobalamin transport system ATPase subunit
MDWNIPRTSDTPLSTTLEVGDRIFIVGANGPGKSALLQNLALLQANRADIRWITAHRQLWLNSRNITLTPHGRREFDKDFQSYNA